MSVKSTLKVMVLAGGPDRERPVSLVGGEQVAAALKQAGHEVMLRDIGPDDLSALDAFVQWGGDVLFPVMHGSWGEGGPLQQLLDARKLPYVGSGAPASSLCMDKHRTKLALEQHGLPTPPYELLSLGQKRSLKAPVVLKATHEGSSIDLFICRQESEAEHAMAQLHERHARVLVERFVTGKELTVGILGTPGRGRAGTIALPPICIVPATEYYDYQAKYTREDTRYLFDAGEMGLTPAVLELAKSASLQAHQACGCRHLSRVDLIVDASGKPWILEINTLPGFTTHSLVPKAAARMGIDMVTLVDRLARMPLTGDGA
ncbi:MAG: D-alanine--D-alanine ligase [Phycisphaeraceae bacterium]|nr:D-alanine--D-alanine ligase [Phycisphaeraceae bacterium]